MVNKIESEFETLICPKCGDEITIWKKMFYNGDTHCFKCHCTKIKKEDK